MNQEDYLTIMSFYRSLPVGVQDMIVCNMVDKCDISNSILRKCFEYENISNFTPIEVSMLFALQFRQSLYTNFKSTIEAQKEIPETNYTVDFYIENYILDGINYKLKKPLIIECDGYDFHSSKEQLTYDRERENELKLLGYDIIRFTGSQIYKDSYKCADDVFKYIKLKTGEDNDEQK